MNGKHYYYKKRDPDETPYQWEPAHPMHRSDQLNPSDYYPPEYFEQHSMQLKAEKLKAKFIAFRKSSVHAAALLDELFGDAAFKVFAHFKLDKLSESKCLELVKLLRPTTDRDGASRELQAISSHIDDEIA